MVVRVISEFDTLDQPFGEPLLGDWLALDLSTIGDKELGCAISNESTGASHILIQCPADTDLAECRICLVVHCWHKDGPRHVCLGTDLGKEPQSCEEGDTGIGKLYVGWLVTQGVHLRSSASCGDRQKKPIFHIRYLSQQDPMGSNRALVRAARINSRHQAGVIMCRMTLLCSRPLIHL